MSQIVFIQRLTAPNITDKEFIRHEKMGLSHALEINKQTGFVLPNCVGYAWGRWVELLGKKPLLSTGNAENWWTKFSDGYERGQTPKLGAVACWRKGLVANSLDGAGHVAIVEDILEDGTIVTSNSAYLGSVFYMRSIKPPYSLGGTYAFQGFIYPDVEFIKEKPKALLSIEEVAYEVLSGKWGNGVDRKHKLTLAGYDSKIVQDKVNEILNNKWPKKTIEQIAQEVIEGKWDVGSYRRRKLEKAGYDYSEVQIQVNILLNSLNRKSKSNIRVAREVLEGRWGNGKQRKEALTKAGYNYRIIQLTVNELIKNKKR